MKEMKQNLPTPENFDFCLISDRYCQEFISGGQTQFPNLLKSKS